jgi:hypothetical protein
MRNWKTVVAGSLYPLAKLIESQQGFPKWAYFVGQALEIVAVCGLGIVAKDYDKSGTPDNPKL